MTKERPLVSSSRRDRLCWGFLMLGVLAIPAAAQDSAPSSHMVFDDAFPGDIIVNEVRVPADGVAMNTYYEALGWRGKAAGYAGIQVHPRSRLFIFSIWDHKAHAAPIKAVHQGPGTEVVGFGGEGTGLKSWNFDLGWSDDVWYTLVSRCWPVGDHTHFGFWARAADSGKWTHLVTMDVAANAMFEGATDAFIEDWSNTGKHARTTHLRGGWKRKPSGEWYPFRSANYSVNSWDLEPGKRSYHYRRRWNGGVAADDTGKYYFMTSGGEATSPKVANPSRHSVPRREKSPAFPKVKLVDASRVTTDDGGFKLEWTTDPTSAPPFAYRIHLFDNPEHVGKPLLTVSAVGPHTRSTTITREQRGEHEKVFVRLELIDIFDRASASWTLPAGVGED